MTLYYMEFGRLWLFLSLEALQEKLSNAIRFTGLAVELWIPIEQQDQLAKIHRLSLA